MRVPYPKQYSSNLKKKKKKKLRHQNPSSGRKWLEQWQEKSPMSHK